MRIEIELIGNTADKYELTTQILDILLKTSSTIGYSYQATTENGKTWAYSSRKLQEQHNDRS